jgi:hypothetical protein
MGLTTAKNAGGGQVVDASRPLQVDDDACGSSRMARLPCRQPVGLTAYIKITMRDADRAPVIHQGARVMALRICVNCESRKA